MLVWLGLFSRRRISADGSGYSLLLCLPSHRFGSGSGVGSGMWIENHPVRQSRYQLSQDELETARRERDDARRNAAEWQRWGFASRSYAELRQTKRRTVENLPEPTGDPVRDGSALHPLQEHLRVWTRRLGDI